MDFKHLKYFVTAAESKSLNQAARVLYTSQPNVTKTIGQLERRWGSPCEKQQGDQPQPLGQADV